ncbi:hypothetical protein [Streptomyces sp. NPDC004728]|uniref:hypothetical protein n=1 Tax=Streptomyces sp. NPDC004728 TaxID=3154289 RepID=UPI0033A3BEB6
MTATEFRAQHGDPATWTDSDFSTYEDFAAADAVRTCWFCAAENPRTRNTCAFCNHHVDDGPDVPLPMPAAA